MDLTKEVNQHLFKRKITDIHEEQTIACEANLPEYFPEITHVLKCSLESKIYSLKQLPDKILLEGAAQYRIFYIGEENTLRCYSQTVPFQKDVETSLPMEAFSHAFSKTEYVNCRVLLPRKLEIRGAISLKIMSYVLEEQSFLSSLGGCGTEIQQEKCTVSSLVGATSSLFSLSETVELSESKATMREILRTDAQAELGSYKLISGKILLKGNVIFKVTYLTDQKAPCVESMRYTVPFSQIIELSGAKENTLAHCHLWLSALDVYPKEDSSGNLRLLDLKITIGADMDVYEEKEIPVLLDAYSTTYDLKLQKQNISLLKQKETIEDTYLFKTTFPLHEPVAKILSARYSDFSYTYELVDNVLHIHGELLLEIILQTTEGETACLEHAAKVEYEHAVPLQETITLNLTFLPCGMEYLMNTSDHLDIRVEFALNAFLFSKTEKTILSSIELSKTKENKSPCAALTLYFANAKETLWDIARHYNTTVSKIQKENNLQNEVLEENCTLFIPRA